MNVFELLNDIIFIEDAEDLCFVNQKLNINNVKIGDVIKQSEQNAKQKEYVVKPLDTISSVAKKLNVAEQLVRQQTSGENLFIGQKILF